MATLNGSATDGDGVLYDASAPPQDAVNPSAVGDGTYKVSLAVATASALARDTNMVVPHFHDGNTTHNPAGLATKLGDQLNTWLTGAYKITVNVYDAWKEKPNPPLATYVKNPAGTFVTPAAPSELALCLSYYSTYNRPRYRGRLYIPLSWINATGATAPPALRPAAAHQTAVMNFATTVLKSAIALGMDWTVVSKKAATSFPVTNYWVDDEWDIQRRRGLRGVTRTQGVYP